MLDDDTSQSPDQSSPSASTDNGGPVAVADATDAGATQAPDQSSQVASTDSTTQTQSSQTAAPDSSDAVAAQQSTQGSQVGSTDSTTQTQSSQTAAPDSSNAVAAQQSTQGSQAASTGSSGQPQGDQTTATFSNVNNAAQLSNQGASAGNSGQMQSGSAAAPDQDYVDSVLSGAVGLSKVSEAAAIIAGAETIIEVIEPIGAVLEIAHMVLGVWDALEITNRTCGYQGLVYGLMYGALGMGDPQPNPTWPNLSDASQHDQRFAEGLADAKSRLANGQDGVRIKNVILLDVAKRGEKAVINSLWQNAVSSDQPLKMFTIEWPNVGPNG
ncbi:MAG: hypothetical protein ACLPHI_04145 [Terriglobales bacterium]|jgi:hypothetical protein